MKPPSAALDKWSELLVELPSGANDRIDRPFHLKETAITSIARLFHFHLEIYDHSPERESLRG